MVFTVGEVCGVTTESPRVVLRLTVTTSCFSNCTQSQGYFKTIGRLYNRSAFMQSVAITCSSSDRSCVQAPSFFLCLVFIKVYYPIIEELIVQELCESRVGRPGLSVLTSLLVSVDVKNY